MGDSSVVEFLRDLSVIIAVGIGTVLLLTLTIVSVMIYRKLTITLTALQRTAQNAQEGSKAILDKVVKPMTGNATASYGAGQVAGFLLGFFKRRNPKGGRKSGGGSNV